ncbi:MAG: DNA modification methylase [Deltaproteobacteria bacterium RBG_13_61_14]|nr:MAG: DNA modification methylase [Deltaproteobacteria bacterium RBG_13_61_14]
MRTAQRSNDISAFLQGFQATQELNLFYKGAQTITDTVRIGSHPIPRYINEYWTSRQRQASSIHEISYRACFKPQLPRFFIELLAHEPDSVVYDPFSGRGTTVIEAGLMGRRFISNDINPLSEILARPRFYVPNLMEVSARLEAIRPSRRFNADQDLSMFYHPDTESEIVALKAYLRERRASGQEDHVDGWIRMVATNRLTGHSPGFFSVYTLPPNQAVTPEAQIKINQKLGQQPEYRNTKKIILRKSKNLIFSLSQEDRVRLHEAADSSLFLCQNARSTPEIEDASVDLTVTSPPFLDVVQYLQDNWLRCWFNSIDVEEIANRITVCKTLQEWRTIMRSVFLELHRITKLGGWVAFEVGEVRNGKINLDEEVVPLGLEAGFTCQGILVNQQKFTKTSNIWGIRNNQRGTNTNRVVLFQKD